jgi:Mg-chelatase subunit ChlD
MRLLLITVVTLLLISKSSFLVAQTLPDNLRVGPIYKDKAGEVAVVVEIPQGVSPQASDFSLLADGRVIANGAEVKQFGKSGRRLAMLFCVDVSGSMKGGPLQDTQQALLTFLGTAGPDDRFGVVAFADTADRDSMISAGRAQLAEKIRGLGVRGGKTRLYSALYDSLDLLQNGDLPKLRRLVVISDGKVEGDSQTLETVTAKANALHIPIYAIGRGTVDQEYQQVLSGLAEATGGEFIAVRPDVLTMREALERIYQQLLHSRLMVVYFRYHADSTRTPSQAAAIELKLAGGKALRAALPEPVPAARTGSLASWLLLGLILLLLAAMAIVLYRRRSRNAAVLAAKEPVASVPAEEAPSDPAMIFWPVSAPDAGSEESGERPRAGRGSTYVGGSGNFPAPSHGTASAMLAGIGGPPKGRRIAIENEIFRIGANRDNDLCLAEDDYVSGTHASIRFEHGNLTVYDEGSRNGTYVNDQEVVDRRRVVIGDKIRIGNSILQIEKARS